MIGSVNLSSKTKQTKNSRAKDEALNVSKAVVSCFSIAKANGTSTHARADIKQLEERFYTCILRLLQDMVLSLGWELWARGESLLLGKFSGLSLYRVISEYLISSDNRVSENLQLS